MNGDLAKSVVTAVHDQDKAIDLVGELIAVAQADSVFGEPVTAGEYTIINASEVSAAVGVGFGVGVGTGSSPNAGQGAGAEGATGPQNGEGGGGGSGGGGGAMARPVATISVGPEGVIVQPIVDVTKLGIAMFTALGTMFLMFSRMRRGR